jgi:cation transporter-like permease
MFRTTFTKLQPLRLSGRYTAAAGAVALGLSSVLLTAVHLDDGERLRNLDDKQNRIANTVVPERVSPGSAVDTSTFLVGSSSGVRRYDTARIARLVLLLGEICIV